MPQPVSATSTQTCFPLHPGAHSHLAALVDGLGRVDQQVHEHLVELSGQAADFRNLLVGLAHLGLVLQFVVHDVEGARQAVAHIHPLPVLVVAGVGEILQILDDLAHPLDALLGFRQQFGHVLQQKAEIRLALGLFEGLPPRRVGDGGHGGLIGRHHAEDIPDILAQGAQVGVQIADGIVDLVGHAGGQLADGGHFLGLHQLFLGALQRLMQGLQILEGVAQLGGQSGLLILGDHPGGDIDVGDHATIGQGRSLHEKPAFLLGGVAGVFQFEFRQLARQHPTQAGQGLGRDGVAPLGAGAHRRQIVHADTEVPGVRVVLFGEAGPGLVHGDDPPILIEHRDMGRQRIQHAGQPAGVRKDGEHAPGLARHLVKDGKLRAGAGQFIDVDHAYLPSS
jgi:hypothetical protein